MARNWFLDGKQARHLAQPLNTAGCQTAQETLPGKTPCQLAHTSSPNQEKRTAPREPSEHGGPLNMANP
eukprot:1154650-Pelagomonas_calceolata.AAC.2